MRAGELSGFVVGRHGFRRAASAHVNSSSVARASLLYPDRNGVRSFAFIIAANW